LDDDLGRYLETISDGRRDLADVAAIDDELEDKTSPTSATALRKPSTKCTSFTERSAS
jgi:hypothetical protein